MAKNVCIVIAFFLLTNGYAQNNFQFVELGYGVYQSKVASNDGKVSEAAIEHFVLDDITLVKKTDRVKAKLGAEFGIAYVLKSNIKDTVMLDIEWVYPKEIKDPSNGAKVKNV